MLGSLRKISNGAEIETPARMKSLLKKAFARTTAFARRQSSFTPVSPLSEEERAHWKEYGYLVLHGFFSRERVEKINRLVNELWERRSHPDNPLVIDVFIETPRSQRIFFKDAPDEAKAFPYKLNDLYLEFEEITDLALDLDLCMRLHDLLEGDPMAINSLNFERGSQQGYHFDTFFMPPRVPNKMLATWIALEDCSLDAGPLTYYPGSHKIKPYYFSNGRLNVVPEELALWIAYVEREIQALGLKPQQFAARAGDVFIWHSQLLHGGSPIKDLKLTRKSLVTHYLRSRDHPGEYTSVGMHRHYLKRAHQPVVHPKP
jgi:phytanoyl-CoA hydroxylase